MMTWRYFGLAGVLVMASGTVNGADPQIPVGLKVVSTIPRTNTEVAAAHQKADLNSCDYLPAGEALVINSFQAYLTARDKKEKLKGIPNPSTRREVLTVGVEVAKEDVSKLPKISGSSIQDYLNSHYISFQLKIQKDPVKGALYLHHRPIAATATFGKAKITEDFVESVAGSVRELHSLGVYLPTKTPPTPENLRTVVLLHKHIAAEKNLIRPGNDRIENHYEYLFIRARSNLAGNKLDIHVFATTEERRKLHYLRTGSNPTNPAGCTLKGEVFFTKFKPGGLEPAESAMRRQVVSAKSSYDMFELDSYTKSNLKNQGDALDNLNNTLDSIIDGKIKPSAKPNAFPTTPAPK
jgi:hypothetical protein